MAVSFSRTTRALDVDNGQASRWIILGALGLLFLWSLWFLAGRIGIYEVSQTARIEVASASGQITAVYGGRLASNTLQIGRVVKAGDVLARLDAKPQQLRLVQAQARLSGFPARIAALERQQAAAHMAMAGTGRAADAAIGAARARARGAEAEATFSDDLAERQRKDSEFGGVAPVDAARSTADARKADAARDAMNQEQQQVAADTQSARAERAASSASLASQIAQTASEWAATRALVDALRAELEAQVIRAPFDGVIGDVAPLRLGEVLGPGTRMATIVPRGDLRIVATFDAARSIGRLNRGQTARLRLDGFAWTQYGDFPAKVERVAAEADGQALRVVLRMPPRTAGALRLNHGMTGKVDVLTEKVSPLVLLLRTLGQWLA